MSPAGGVQGQTSMDAENKQKVLQNQDQIQNQQNQPREGVRLEPFVHQVGGHSFVLRFGDQTICKPLVPREHQFYKNLPPTIRRFIPQFRGVVSVSFEEDEDGNLFLMAYPLHTDPSSDQENKDSSANSELRTKTLKCGKTSSKDVQRPPPTEPRVFKLQEGVELQQEEVNYFRVEVNMEDPQIKHNPWSFKCHQKHLQKMKENLNQNKHYKFILLENLTWQHVVPCVLDLKMGTRQHGDDASEEKAALQINKCALSTSASIGVRVSGMQVYQADAGQLVFMNKRCGRKLSLSGFKEALYQFFHSGRRIRQELLRPVLTRLQEMKEAMEECDSYRFYSSSLLILYDGAPHRRSTEGDEEEEGEGGDQLRMEDKEEEAEVAGAPSSSTSSEGGEGVVHAPSSSSSCSSSDVQGAKVDVRVIDFAHATSRHFKEDRVTHHGQDTGFLLGLNNLISTITELESQD